MDSVTGFHSRNSLLMRMRFLHLHAPIKTRCLGVLQFQRKNRNRIEFRTVYSLEYDTFYRFRTCSESKIKLVDTITLCWCNFRVFFHESIRDEFRVKAALSDLHNSGKENLSLLLFSPPIRRCCSRLRKIISPVGTAEMTREYSANSA